jgi:23S rRNA pseudouridine2605 synthase
MRGLDRERPIKGLRGTGDAITAISRVALNRALSKLGVLSRTAATAAIRGGRVRVDGRVVRDPLVQVDPTRATRRLAAWI